MVLLSFLMYYCLFTAIQLAIGYGVYRIVRRGNRGNAGR